MHCKQGDCSYFSRLISCSVFYDLTPKHLPTLFPEVLVSGLSGTGGPGPAGEPTPVLAAPAPLRPQHKMGSVSGMFALHANIYQSTCSWIIINDDFLPQGLGVTYGGAPVCVRPGLRPDLWSSGYVQSSNQASNQLYSAPRITRSTLGRLVSTSFKLYNLEKRQTKPQA